MSKQIFLWHGDNDFDMHEQLNLWRKAFETKYSGLNISIFEFSETKSDKTEIANLKNALQVDSLFGSNKLVVLKNFLLKKNKLSEELENMILSTAEKLPPSFFLVFMESAKPEAKNKIYLLVQKLIKNGTAEIKPFILPKERELVSWITTRAHKKDFIMTQDAVYLLASMIGPDLWQLSQEMDKLANYKREDRVNATDVTLLVQGKYNNNIFELMDAISAKNKKKALKLFSDQLNSGAEEMYLLTMLARQFRILLLIKDSLTNESLSSDLIAKKLGLHPFVVKKTMDYVRNFTLDQLKKIYAKLLEFDIQIKTKSVSFELLFDLLIAEL